MAKSGETNLGGQDFVVKMMEYHVKDIEAIFCNEVAEDKCILRDVYWRHARRLNACFLLLKGNM